MKHLIIIAALLTATSARADFQMDKTAPEIRAAIKKPAIINLAVGETGIKNRPFFCVKDGGLFIIADLPLDDKKSDYGLSFKVKRMPNETVSLEVSQGKSMNDDPTDTQIAAMLNEASIGTCEVKSLFGTSLLSVSDINGKTKASDFLAR